MRATEIHILAVSTIHLFAGNVGREVTLVLLLDPILLFTTNRSTFNQGAQESGCSLSFANNLFFPDQTVKGYVGEHLTKL